MTSRSARQPLTNSGRPRNNSGYISGGQPKAKHPARLHGPVDNCTVTRFDPTDPQRRPTDTYVIIPAADQTRRKTTNPRANPRPVPTERPAPRDEQTRYPTSPDQMTPDQARTILGLDHLSASVISK